MHACDNTTGVMSCGILSSYDDWVSIFGSADYCYGEYHSLWYVQQDGLSSFTDYVEFGCFSTSIIWGKTINEASKYCNLTMEMVYAPYN